MGALGKTACRFGAIAVTAWFTTGLYSSVAAQTCPNTVIAGDQAIWADGTAMTHNWYRDAFAAYYGLYRGDWTGGWGWSKHNDPGPHRWEFPKMMSAGRLLWGGIDDRPGTVARLSQGAWSVQSVVAGAAPDYPVTRTASRTADEVDLLYKSAGNELMHVLFSDSPWNPGVLPPPPVSVSVSDLVADAKSDYRISGSPAIGLHSANNLEIVARETNGLLHFRWSQATGWSVQDATTSTVRPSPVNGSDRYFISTDPVVLRRNSTEFDVFALDNFRHLIHYMWHGAGWIAEDVTHQLQDGFTLAGDPVPVRRNDGTIDVFGRNSLGRLIHYEWVPGTGWSSEEITAAIEGLATNERVDSQPAVAYLDNQGMLVYYRVGWKLFMVAYAPPLINWVRLQIADDYVIDSDPVVAKRTPRAIHGFVREFWTGNLIHFYLTSELGFGSERLAPSGIADDPTVVVTNENRLDLFARNGTGHLFHLYWAHPGGWRNENINLTAGVSPTFDTVGLGRAAVARGESSIEVFGERNGFPQLTVHFSSAFGPAVSSWHTNDEYAEWASGTLRDFKYQPANSFDERANALRGWWLWDRVEMECPMFAITPATATSAAVPAATPASRAGTMLHEATHMIFWDFPHQANLPTSTCATPCSDNWIFHGARDEAGTLATAQNHSMNQVQIEYLTDISQFSESWVPAAAFAGAQAEATNRMNNRILNPPGWTPGLPRPLN